MATRSIQSPAHLLTDVFSEIYVRILACGRTPEPLDCFADVVENLLRSRGISEVSFVVGEKPVKIALHPDAVEVFEGDKSEKRGRLRDFRFDFESLLDILIPYIADVTGVDVRDLARTIGIHNISDASFTKRGA